jgi:beta-fructofuranosidase
MIEVFVNDGRACITRKIFPRPDDMGFEVFSENGTTLIKSFDFWKLKEIW